MQMLELILQYSCAYCQSTTELLYINFNMHTELRGVVWFLTEQDTTAWKMSSPEFQGLEHRTYELWF